MMGISYETVRDPIKRLGLVVLRTDEIIEREMAQVLPLNDTTRLHVSRIPFAPEVTQSTLAQMAVDLPASVRLFPDAPFDVVGYGCTSGATVIGSSRISDLITSSCRTGAACDPIASVIAAAEQLGVRNLGMVTPYITKVSNTMRQHLEASGIAVSALESFNIIEDSIVAQVSPTSIKDAAIRVGQGECDAVFISCTNLAALGVIVEIESIIGKPVLTSNQALAWAMCQAAGLRPQHGFGQLLTQ